MTETELNRLALLHFVKLGDPGHEMIVVIYPRHSPRSGQQGLPVLEGILGDM